jgi:Raf kinase inhibitor-like YbhB/YbcL family protein
MKRVHVWMIATITAVGIALGLASCSDDPGTIVVVKEASADAPASPVDSGLSLDTGATAVDGATDAPSSADADAASVDAAPVDSGPPPPLALTSAAFADGAIIPTKYTCNTALPAAPSPPLAWTGGPVAASYAVVMIDESLTGPNNVHWVIYDLAPATTSLPEGVPTGYAIAAPAAHQARDSFSGTFAYFNPCPPPALHTYAFTLYALDVATLPVVMTDGTGAVIAQIKAHMTASARLTGKYAGI